MSPENWQRRPASTTSDLTLHAGPMASSLISPYSGVSLNELVMQSEHPAFTSIPVVNSPGDVGPAVNICHPNIMHMEEGSSAMRSEFSTAAGNYFSALISNLSSMDSQKSQTGFLSTSSMAGKQDQGTLAPYNQLQAHSGCNYPSSSSNHMFHEQSQGLVHGSVDCFSNAQIAEQIYPFHGHINPSLLQSLISSNGDLASPSTREDMHSAGILETPLKTPATSTAGISFDVLDNRFSPADHMPGSTKNLYANMNYCDDFGSESLLAQVQDSDSCPTMAMGFPSVSYKENNSQTLGWQSQSSITDTNSSAQMQFSEASIRSQNSKDGLQLPIAQNSLKRAFTINIGDDMQPPTKKLLSWSSQSNACSTVQSKSPKLKSRAKQGSATDPQSVAARLRRERISERLKILQDLVPNGSKVDLVTMLEKAINYVKFLQLQVKVLTTDEYWPQKDSTSAAIVKVQDVLQEIASNRSLTDPERTSSTREMEKRSVENFEN